MHETDCEELKISLDNLKEENLYWKRRNDEKTDKIDRLKRELNLQYGQKGGRNDLHRKT